MNRKETNANAKANAKRKALKRVHILESAVKAFSRHGYHNCTMAQVAREAGVADGTLYLYVENKQDLLVSAFTQVLDRMMEELDEELAKIESPLDKVARLVELHLMVMASDPDLAGFLQFQLRQPDEQVREAIREPLVGYAKRIERIIEEGKEKGVFRREIGTRTLRRLIFGAIDETVSTWWLRRDSGELMDKAAPLCQALLYGLCAPAK